MNIAAVASEFPGGGGVLTEVGGVVVQRKVNSPSSAALGSDQREGEVEVSAEQIDLFSVAAPVRSVGAYAGAARVDASG